MSNQAMTYESLKEAIRQEFEDVSEPGQTFFFCRIGLNQEMSKVFVDVCPGAITSDTLGICTEINAPIQGHLHKSPCKFPVLPHPSPRGGKGGA